MSPLSSLGGTCDEGRRHGRHQRRPSRVCPRGFPSRTASMPTVKRNEGRRAPRPRAISGGRGLLGVNVMVASTDYDTLCPVRAVEAGADAIISAVRGCRCICRLWRKAATSCWRRSSPAPRRPSSMLALAGIPSL